MFTRHRTITALLFVVVALVAVTAPASAGDWTMFGNTTDHHGNANDATITTANVTRLTRLWAASTGDEIWSSPAIAGGIVYVGSNDGYVYAFSAATGAKRWAYKTGGKVMSSPAVAGGIVYAGSYDHKLYALDALTGAKRWSYDTGDYIHFNPTVSGGVVFVASQSKKLFALNATTGALKWSTSTYTPSWSSPAIGDGRVYLGWDDGTLRAYDLATGAPRWTANSDGGRFRCAPTYYNGLVLIGDDDAKVYAFDAATGARKWARQTAPLSTTPLVRSTPSVSADGTTYVTTGEETGAQQPMEGHVYALDVKTGAIKWVTELADYSSSSTVVSNGVLYATSFDHQLYAFNAKTGAQLWSSGFSTMTAGVPGSPALSNGVLFVGSQDKRLHAFGIATGTPVSTYVDVTDSALSPDTVGHKQGYAIEWSFKGTKSATVTETSGAKFFDSGSKAPGSTYKATLVGAGVYYYRNSLNAAVTGIVKVPILLTPASGAKTSTFSIKWAGGAPASGYVFDVEIKRPGDTAWTSWKKGTTTQSANFVPDKGAGTYWFRSHVRNVSNGKASGFSTAKSISAS